MTALKPSEMDLARAHDEYLLLLERFPAMIWRTGSNGWCDYHNQTWLEFTGRTFEQEQGAGWAESVHPDDIADVHRCLKAAFEGRDPFEMEYRLLHHSGQYRRVSDHARPILDMEGRFGGYLGACFDISQRESAHAALRESEEIFRSIIETSAVGVARTDPVGRFLLTNVAYQQMLGYTADELKRRSVADVTHPDDWPQNRQFFERLIHREIPSFDIEKRYRRKDGTDVWVHNSVSAVFDASGRPLFVHAVSQDITEPRRFREELEKREILLREAQDLARMGSWEWDLRHGQVEWADTEFRLFGLTPGSIELTYENFIALVHPEDRALVQDDVRRTFETGESETTFRIFRSDGSTRWIQSRRRLMRDEAGEPMRMIGTSYDITPLKEAEEAVRILAEAGVAFGRSLDYRQTLGEVAKLAIPALADFCFFDMSAEDGHSERFVLLHRDPGMQGTLEDAVRFVPPPELENHPVTKVLRSGEPVLVTEADDDWKDRAALNPEHARLMRDLDVRSLLTVPVHGPSRVLGALTFIHTGASGRRFSRRELPLFEELARRAGVALENARLHGELRNREALLAEAQRIAHVGSWVWDIEGDEVRWSDELYHIYGRGPGTFPLNYESYLTCVHPKDRERVVRIVKEAHASAESLDYVHDIVRPDGEVRTIHARSRVLRDDTGRAIRMLGVDQDITELRKAQEALEASEERYRILTEHSADLITQQTPDGEILYVSPAIDSLFGYSAEEVVGRNGREFIHAADLERIESLRLKLLHGEPPGTVIFRMRRKSGEYRWIETTAQAVSEPGSTRFASVISVSRDITDSVRAADRDRLLQTITAVANEAVDTGSALQLTLAKICEHTGWEAGHVGIGESAGRSGSIDIWHLREPERLPAYRAALERIPALGGNSLFDRVLSSGRAEWIEDLSANAEMPVRSVFAFPIRIGDRTDAVLEFFSHEPRPRDELLVGTLTEIGIQLGEMIQRLRAEAALAASEMRFRALSESAHDTILTLDADGEILYCNESLKRIFGYECGDLIGRPFTSLLLNDTPARRSEASAFVDLMKARDPALIGRVVELPGRRRDGSEVPIELTFSWWETDGRMYFSAILRDITARKQVEEQLQQNMTELARSNSELGLFTYVASHDLREPLRTVASNVQLLRRRLGEEVDAASRKEMDFAIDGVGRMQALLDNLLAYSRVGTDGKAFAEVETERVFTEAVQSLRIAIEESRAEVRHDPLPAVFGDRSQLAQLFQNLLSNAIKFHGDAPPRVSVSAERDGDEWMFTVRDNGIGIEPEYLDQVFTIFQRLHSADEYPGTGLGLALSRKIVERHGGKIWTESEPGTGSAFRFTLPARERRQRARGA